MPSLLPRLPARAAKHGAPPGNDASSSSARPCAFGQDHISQRWGGGLDLQSGERPLGGFMQRCLFFVFLLLHAPLYIIARTTFLAGQRKRHEGYYSKEEGTNLRHWRSFIFIHLLIYINMLVRLYSARSLYSDAKLRDENSAPPPALATPPS